MAKKENKTKAIKEAEEFHAPKKIPFYKKKTYIIPAVLVVAVILWSFFSGSNQQLAEIRTMMTERADLMQEVSVTGSVEPAESVNLSFEITGKVNEIYADVGDRVEAGQKLISLGNAEIQAQLNQAYAGAASANALVGQYQAALDSQVALLEELKKGTRPEELQLVQTAVNNAQKSLTDSQNNLNTVTAKAETDLDSVYDSARTSLPTAVEAGKTALLSLSDIQAAYFTTANQEKFTIESAKSAAVYELLGGVNAGAWIRQYVSTLSGGVYGNVQTLSPLSDGMEIENTLRNSINALQKVRIALNSVPIKDEMSSTDVSKLESEKSSINTQINTLSGHEQSINLQKATNENLITSAENAVNTAQSALYSAEDELRLKQAGSTDEQIRAQEAVVRQAEASLRSQRAQVSSQYAIVQNYQAQLEKTVLNAPISGLVTKMEAKVGEIVFPSSPYSDSRVTFVSIISDKNYEIETNVAEVDIAKIEIGDMSRITLDAYGSERVFEAMVTGVDPAETLIEGIPTYKVTLEFAEESNDIKSGMTANIDILTDMKEMVIAIPQRAVITKDGKKFVKVQKGENAEGPIIEEVEILTGIRGSDGSIEVIEGLTEGEEIVISTE